MWRNTLLKTQHSQSFSTWEAPKFSDFAISNGCCGNILCPVLCGKEDQHLASCSEQLSAYILTIFVFHCDRVPGTQHHPLSQVLLAVVLGWLGVLFLRINPALPPATIHLSKSCAAFGPQFVKSRISFAKRSEIRQPILQINSCPLGLILLTTQSPLQCRTEKFWAQDTPLFHTGCDCKAPAFSPFSHDLPNLLVIAVLQKPYAVFGNTLVM